MTRCVELVVGEGMLEIPAAQKIIYAIGLETDRTVLINKRGRHAFWKDAPRYNKAAAHLGPIFALADLESEPCPSGLIAGYLRARRHPHFVLRVAERMLESWLLADTSALAKYLRVSARRFPRNPDTEPNPKRTLVNLARQSTSRSLKQDLVPDQDSRGLVGKGYVPRMTEFIETAWRPLEARSNSESLRRAIAAIQSATAP